MTKITENLYKNAKDRYAAIFIDVEKAIFTLKETAVSVNCWQGDDVGGFEREKSTLNGGGILITGSYPGKPRNINEFRKDAEKAFSMLPGKKKFALQAVHGDYQNKLKERDNIEIKYFKSWVDWAKANNIALDYNPSLFFSSIY